jgi:chemotaxis protein MotB
MSQAEELENQGELEKEEHDGSDELWLISYSDLMTLLFGFFVLMYAMKDSSPQQKQAVKESIERAITGNYQTQEEKITIELQEAVKKSTENLRLAEIEIDQPKDGLEITFRSNLLFASGSADLIPEMQETMKMVIEIISKNANNSEIQIAGHTDDNPIHTPKFPSNWELSTARAATVVKAFEYQAYTGHLLVAMGYGSTRPTLPNRDENGRPIPTNQEKNRRVVIKVVSANKATNSKVNSDESKK